MSSLWNRGNEIHSIEVASTPSVNGGGNAVSIDIVFVMSEAALADLPADVRGWKENKRDLLFKYKKDIRPVTVNTGAREPLLEVSLPAGFKQAIRVVVYADYKNDTNGVLRRKEIGDYKKLTIALASDDVEFYERKSKLFE